MGQANKNFVEYQGISKYMDKSNTRETINTLCETIFCVIIYQKHRYKNYTEEVPINIFAGINMKLLHSYGQQGIVIDFFPKWFGSL